MPSLPSETAPVAHPQHTPLTDQERARLVSALFDLDELPKRRRRLLPEYEQECADAMLAELPRGRR